MPRRPEIQTVAFVSLGCPKNLVDSERMLGLLAADGLAITPHPEDADVIVINTCGFLEAAKLESLEQVRRAINLKQSGSCKRVIVAGCLAQREKTKLLDEVPEIDRLVGVFDREHIVEAVRGKANPRQEHGHFLGKYHGLSRGVGAASAAAPVARTTAAKAAPTAQHSLPVFEDDCARLRLTPRHYAYLRVSEGCNQGCSFCTIPSIRGPMRSKPLSQILAEARELAADGAVELNLIGQDTTSYGTDIDYAPGLAGMLRELDRALDRDVQWVRLMYAYPSRFTDAMIDAIADSTRIVKYIDIPLQHINDEVLLRMRRRVTRKQTETLLEKLRQRIPGIAIRTTFIAGSPGETEAQHQELVRFVREFGFEMMGVFPYSRERGTSMGRMEDQLGDDVKSRWVEELMLVQQEVAFARAKALVGRETRVLVDAAGGKIRAKARTTNHNWTARAAWQAPEIDSTVQVKGCGLHPGAMIDVRITGASRYDLIAEPVAGKSRSLTVLA